MRSDSIKNPDGEEQIVRAAMRACRYARLRRAANETLRGSSYLKIGVVIGGTPEECVPTQ